MRLFALHCGKSWSLHIYVVSLLLLMSVRLGPLVLHEDTNPRGMNTLTSWATAKRWSCYHWVHTFNDTLCVSNTLCYYRQTLESSPCKVDAGMKVFWVPGCGNLTAEVLSSDQIWRQKAPWMDNNLHRNKIIQYRMDDHSTNVNGAGAWAGWGGVSWMWVVLAPGNFRKESSCVYSTLGRKTHVCPGSPRIQHEGNKTWESLWRFALNSITFPLKSVSEKKKIF